MKLAWIRWQGGIETRDDGFKIYPAGLRVLLVFPDKKRVFFETRELAKRFADEFSVIVQKPL